MGVASCVPLLGAARRGAGIVGVRLAGKDAVERAMAGAVGSWEDWWMSDDLYERDVLAWPESQAATDGISRSLVQVHTKTAPICSGPT